MISKLKEEWMHEHSPLKHWALIDSLQDKKCGCVDKSYLVELQEHDSCIRGRIDTVVCTMCNKIESFRIIR